MKNKQIALSLLLVLAGTVPSFSQARIVIMGSSTAEGWGASVPDSSFAARTQAYYRQNAADGVDTIVENIGFHGLDTYNEMPDGFIAPPGRPGIIVERNVTWALRNHPNAVIINLPTNDVANGYSKKEYMNNLRYMYNKITSERSFCYITTTQPRELPVNQLDSLRTLVDSIKNNFGIFAIDFWTDLYLSTVSPFKPEVRFDGIHVNNLGHRYLFNRVISTVFLAGGPLPIKLKKFGVALNQRSILVKWQTDFEEDNTVFELQRSGPNNLFITVHAVNATGRAGVNNYEWADLKPLPGDNLYRLKIKEQGQAVVYSEIQSVRNASPGLDISRIAIEAGRLVVEVQLGMPSATFSVFNNSGSLLYRQVISNSQPRQLIYVPASVLTTGILLVKMEGSNGQNVVRRFIR